MRLHRAGARRRKRCGAARPSTSVRFSTRRRLIIAFVAVFAASISAPAFHLVALRRMEATLAALEEQEKRMSLALELEDAVHTQYEDAARFVVERGDETLADYEHARSHALALTHALTERMDRADAIAWETRIRDATAQLAQVVRGEAASPAAASAAPAAALHHDRSYGVVLLIEQGIHEYFGQLQVATAAFRKELVGLERAALRWTGLLLVVIPVLVAAAVLYLSRSIARPLARLSEGAAALAGGDLETRIALDTPDEFGALAAKFNSMTVALKQHQARLVESEKLAGIGRVAAGVAHELNNPLQVMLGYLSLNRDVPDGRLREQLAAVEDETLRCKAIVDGMIELARPAATTAAAVDLRELCDDVSTGLRASARGTSRLLVEGTAVAIAERARIRQIVFNLVKNAVEAAGPGGEVRVAIGTSGRMAEVAVSDGGPGIAPEARARLFEPFFTTKPTGTGLGLAVSRAIARTHGGDIEVRNGDPGGAVFTLRLPRAPESEDMTWIGPACSSSRTAPAS